MGTVVTTSGSEITPLGFGQYVSDFKYSHLLALLTIKMSGILTFQHINCISLVCVCMYVCVCIYIYTYIYICMSVQFSSFAQLCPTLCDLMDYSMPGFPVYHQFPESTQTHVYQVSDAIQPSHPLTFPSPPTFNLPQHRGLSQ